MFDHGLSLLGNSESAAIESAHAMGVVAYRSRAAAYLSGLDLDRILAVAQDRNRSAGITGLLIYDSGYFFQWLEGPVDALARVLLSIKRDPRHSHLEVLRQDLLSNRLFPTWQMRIVRCSPGLIEQQLSAGMTPQLLVNSLRGQASAVSIERWMQVLSTSVIPDLMRNHAQLGESCIRDGGVGELARLLLSTDLQRVASHVDGLLAQGADLAQLYGDLFEPTQRYLGDLSLDDRCNDFELTMALAKLQVEVRRLGMHFAYGTPHGQEDRSILLSVQPGESHTVGLAMSCELFLQEGWDVTCEFPRDDAGLCGFVHSQWFDVLDLSLSSALRRDHQLAAMRDTIRAVHSASLNPGLKIIVQGRRFFEQRSAYKEIHADAGCASVLDGIAAANQAHSETCMAAAATG